MLIEDGQGTGYKAHVTNENELSVRAVFESIQRHRSENGDAYQVIGDFTAVNNSTFTVLHIKNTHTSKVMYITYIRVQPITLSGGAFSSDTFFSIGTGRTVGSGGTAVTPVNMNLGSGKTANATCTDNNPTMAGTYTEFDRWYPEGNAKMQVFNKEGAISLSQNDTIEIKFRSNHTDGTVYSRISFVYDSENR